MRHPRKEKRFLHSMLTAQNMPAGNKCVFGRNQKLDLNCQTGTGNRQTRLATLALAPSKPLAYSRVADSDLHQRVELVIPVG
jgi:hypothetical protein